MTSGLLTLVAACADQAVGPTGPPPAAPSADLARARVRAKVTTFRYHPLYAKTFKLGDGHQVRFSAAAVCNPRLSTYGPTEWDKPCVALRTPINITATSYTDVNGRPRIDFSPDLRFVPGSEVVLYMRDPEAALDSTATINWCGPDGTCVDEALERPGLRTRRDGSVGQIYRKIKHFSGYNVSAGRSAVAY